MFLLGLISVVPVVLAGTFDVLSINVAGLPWILNSNGETGNKTANAELLGKIFSQQNYSVIHCEEVSPPE